MTTRDDAIRGAGDVLAEAELGIRRGTVREAAERASRPGGPPLVVLEQRIRDVRARDAERAAQIRAS